MSKVKQDRLQEARRHAKALRGEWELSTEPVKVFRVLEDHEYNVVRWTMESNVSGCLAEIPDVGPVIFVNTLNRTLGHQHFTAIHEMYHHRYGKSDVLKWENLQDHDDKPLEESLADVFTAEFLLPGPGIKAAMEDMGVTGRELEPEHVVEIQMRFEVSYKFLVFRLDNLGFITTHKKNKLLEEIQPLRRALELGYDDLDIYGQEGPFYPKQFRFLAIKALKENLISAKKFRSVLELGEERYQRYLQEFEPRKADKISDKKEPPPVTSTSEIIERIKKEQELFSEYKINKFILFGSALRDELTPESDIDMVVFADELKGYWKLTELRLKLEDILGRKVDLATPVMVEHIWDEEIKDRGVELRAV